MLTVEEQQNSIRYSVELDHCYTSRSSPSDPKPRDPLPTTDSPTTGDTLQYTRQLSPVHAASNTVSPAVETESIAPTKAKVITKTVSILYELLVRFTAGNLMFNRYVIYSRVNR